ncbi:hypothetical protein GCM10017673_33120 [Streptosporangium violaceochromogenes]|nr:hypothetical protein GCM10017673_33120 [Streptosporangium violaceochromogenes]
MAERDYALDVVEGDRYERAIMFHMVLSLVAGLALGALGAVLARGTGPLPSIYQPYAFILLVVVVGRTAAGLGWALLAGTLAAFGPIISLLVFTLLDPAGSLLGAEVDGPMLNLMVATLAAFAVLAHLTKRKDRWADVANGALAGAVMVDAADKSLGGGLEHVYGFWPWNALLVTAGALGLLFALRREERKGSLRRAALVAAAVVCSAFAAAAGL